MSAKNDKASRSPQERASEHLKKMLRNAAVGGAALGLSGGCGSCGPMVCDPMPTPICNKSPTTGTFLNSSSHSATWKQVADGGALGVEVSIQLYGDGETITFSADPSLTDAALGAVKRDGASITFSFVPGAGATKVEAILQVDCATIPEVLKLSFDVSSPSAGAAVTITSLE